MRVINHIKWSSLEWSWNIMKLCLARIVIVSVWNVNLSTHPATELVYWLMHEPSPFEVHFVNRNWLNISLWNSASIINFLCSFSFHDCVRYITLIFKYLHENNSTYAGTRRLWLDICIINILCFTHQNKNFQNIFHFTQTLNFLSRDFLLYPL